MGAWRRKLVFLLIVYFAGFATAIYCLAPAPDYRSANPDDESLAASAFKSDEFAKSFNTGMHKCLGFGKDAARQAGAYLKQKLDKDRQS
jgi:hypothetical protein